jgi:hypothetical protein
LAASIFFSHFSRAAPKASRLAHEALHERSDGSGAGEGGAEAYADRAYPASDISIDEIEGGIAANDAVPRTRPAC